MSSILDYARPPSADKTNAVSALVCGLCSGPVGFGLALLGSANSWSEGTKEALGWIALALTMGGALVYGCVIKLKMPASASQRDHAFTTVGIVITGDTFSIDGGLTMRIC